MKTVVKILAVAIDLPEDL